MATAPTDCRFYENKYPKVDELVMVNVKRVADMGAYVSLLEYNNTEGMVLMSELSKRRFRSVNKLIKVGRLEVVMVLRVDEDKGYIDLSKKRVTPEDIAKCEEKYSRGRAIYTIMRHVAQQHNKTTEELMQMVTWKLAHHKGGAFDALKESVLDPERILGPLNLPPEIRDSLIADVKRRLSPSAIRLRARIDCTCFAYEGIDAVKRALIKGQEAGSNEDVQVSIKLIAPPSYMIVTSCLDKEEGTKQINIAMDVIKEEMEKAKGQFTLKSAVTVVGGDDEKRLDELLKGKEEEDESDEDGSDEDGSEEEDNHMGAVDDDIPDAPPAKDGDDEDDE